MKLASADRPSQVAMARMSFIYKILPEKPHWGPHFSSITLCTTPRYKYLIISPSGSSLYLQIIIQLNISRAYLSLFIYGLCPTSASCQLCNFIKTAMSIFLTILLHNPEKLFHNVYVATQV